MLNETTIAGEVDTIYDLPTTSTGKKETVVIIKVERDFPRDQHKEKYLYVPVILWEEPAYTAKSICKKGSKLAIKGRICSDEKSKLKIVCEKIIFMDRYFES